jgi:cytochrome c-type biogenesis protein CcmF
MLVGILLSSSKKQVLSINTTGINLPFDPATKQDPMENLTLIRGTKTDMGKYWATYVRNDSVDEHQINYFQVHFDKKDGSEQFDLYPFFIKNTKGQEGSAPNPDNRHYWNKDIFSYVNAYSREHVDDTVTFRPSVLAMKDTVYYSKGFVILDSVIINPNNDRYHFGPNDTALMARVTVVGQDSTRSIAYPVFYLKDNMPRFINDTVFTQDLAIRFNRVAENRKIELGLKESANMVPFIALKVLEFPQINILWIGTIIMITGFVMSIVWRRRQGRLAKV